MKNKLEKMKETYVMLWELTVEFVIPVLSVMFVVAVVLPPIIRGMPPLHIFIMGGNTEQAIYDELNGLGILKGIPIHKDNSLDTENH